MVMLRGDWWGDCCTIFHQDTELSHTYHISLSSCFLSVLSLSPTNARSSSSLLFHISSSHYSIPLTFTLALIPTSLSLPLGELCTVSSPLCGVHLVLSGLPLPLLLTPSSSPLLSGCFCFVFFLSYLALLLFRGFMPFTWEPFYPSLRALRSAVPTYSCLSVCAVSGSEWTGGGARRQEWANSQLSSQMLLSVLPVLFLVPLSSSLSASLHHDLPSVSPCKPLYPCKQRVGGMERGDWGKRGCEMQSRRQREVELVTRSN